jgi:hypothetical protein
VTDSELDTGGQKPPFRDHERGDVVDLTSRVSSLGAARVDRDEAAVGEERAANISLGVVDRVGLGCFEWEIADMESATHGALRSESRSFCKPGADRVDSTSSFPDAH